MKRFQLVLAACTLAALPPLYAAEPRPPAADPNALVAQPVYESAFANYRSYQEPSIRSWTEVNDEVARAGGQAGIFRDAGGAHGAVTPPAQPTGETPSAQAQSPVRGAPVAPAAQPHH